MHYKERVVKGAIRSEHIVQIFDSVESLAQSVSEYLLNAYRADQNLLIVAKPQHWESIEPALRSAGCDVAAGLERERILVLDAITTVRAICRDELPSRARFDELIGRLTRRLGGRTGLCAYGEMVDVLAEEGNLRGAMLLEELWNGVAERTSLSLMCGYSSAHFVSGDGKESLTQICRLHSGVRATAEDPLAGWLLQKAGLPFESGLAGAGS
jgi:hypothetical protein